MGRRCQHSSSRSRRDDASERLDVVLARRVPGLSRDRVKALFEAGEVRVNGRRAKKSALVAAGDRVILESLPGPTDFHAVPDPDLSIEVILEREGFVVVDKPSGVPSHPLREGELGTLAGALVARYPEMRGVGYSNREPGILHRLDNDTSGLMLAARDRETFEALRQQTAGGRDRETVHRSLHGNRHRAPVHRCPHRQRSARPSKGPRLLRPARNQTSTGATGPHRGSEKRAGYRRLTRRGTRQQRPPPPGARSPRLDRPPAPGRHPLRRPAPPRPQPPPPPRKLPILHRPKNGDTLDHRKLLNLQEFSATTRKRRQKGILTPAWAMTWLPKALVFQR